MPVERGFVEALEIGRAGQAVVVLLHIDGTRVSYTISDLDGDPERFNERLSKLGLLRDAMDRAEPVEIEFDDNDDAGGRAIDRVRRLTRDSMRMPRETNRVSGTVIGVAVAVDTRPVSTVEAAGGGVISLLVDGAIERFVLDMQMPERHVAMTMMDVARGAQRIGARLNLTYGVKQHDVVAVETGSEWRSGDGSEQSSVAGFVETLAHTDVSDVMIAEVTTAPGFDGPGGTVPLTPFEPERHKFLLIRGSPEYALFEVALRDMLRLEIASRTLGPRVEGLDFDGVLLAAAFMTSDDNVAESSPVSSDHIALVRGVRLCHALCSASRPVWIRVDRKALEVGPDADCIDGLPSSDLTPRGLREIDLPYTADWIGIGCFNHGVYRFELGVDAEFELAIDGSLVCLHHDEESGVRFGHACVDGEHEVRVRFAAWRCRDKFDMDVYRIR